MNKPNSDKTPTEKKSETLEVRLPYSVKRAFMKAASQNGETASEAVRNFIDQYLEDARQATHKTTLQEMMMTIDHNRKKTAALLTGFAVSALAFAAMPSAADDGVFTTLDKNGDGILTIGEIGRHDEGVIKALDTDGSGDVSADEFRSKASIVKVDRDGVESTPDGKVRIIEASKTEFDLSDPERVEISVRKAVGEFKGDLSETETQELIDKILKELEES